jgi:hypothetical protein
VDNKRLARRQSAYGDFRANVEQFGTIKGSSILPFSPPSSTQERPQTRSTALQLLSKTIHFFQIVQYLQAKMQFKAILITALFALSEAAVIDQAAPQPNVARGLEKRDIKCIPKDGSWGRINELEDCVNDLRQNRKCFKASQTLSDVTSN